MDEKLARKIGEVCALTRKADLIIRNVRAVDVYCKETFEADISVIDGHIASFSPEVSAETEIDGKGMYLVPGFIDAHCHIESSHLSPPAFSDLVVPKGTTTAIADPHEICNVKGLKALEYMLRSSEDLPLSVYLMFPSCVPATPYEHSGAELDAEAIRSMIDNPRILGLGEMMNYPGVIAGDESVLDKLEAAYKAGKLIDGHAPGVEARALDAYSGARIITDHECTTHEEMREKLRRGMYIAMREGTACRNVEALIKGADDLNLSRLLFCTDDCQPQSIIENGHLNHAVNLAIEAGMKSETAISIATLNAAVCYGLRDRGGIAPGLRADFFLARSLKRIEPEKVFILGHLAAENGRIASPAVRRASGMIGDTMEVKDLTLSRLRLPISGKAKVIGISGGSIVTSSLALDVASEDGVFVRDDRDILKIVSIERHRKRGTIGVGLITGYGLRKGAIATTISHDSHNIIAIGASDQDILLAAQELIRCKGGITLVKDGKVLKTHVLEIAGLMCERSADEVYQEIKEMQRIAYEELGVSRDIDPFMTLSFMALPVIPHLKITDSGLFDVDSFSFTGIDAD